MDCPLPPGSTVVAYARDSGGQAQDRSVGQQLAAIEAYCQENGLVLVRTFTDEAAPGSTTVGRDAFLEMVAWLRRLAPEPEAKRPRRPDAPDGVAFWDLRRFGRDQDDSAFFRADLRRRGYTVISLADAIPAGDLAPVFESLFSWKAQEDLHGLSRDVKRGLANLMQQRDTSGHFLHCWTGQVPPGFRRIEVAAGVKRDGRLRLVQGIEPDPGGQWEQVRVAFELRANGASLQRIHQATALCRRRRGYQHLFRNQLYRGRLVYGELAVDGWIEPCVDEATWQAVQAVNAGHDRSPRLGTSSYTLSGWFRCGECGAGLTGKTNTLRRGERVYRYRRYACSQGRSVWEECSQHRLLDAGRLEAAVYRVLAETVLQPDVVAEQLAASPDPPSSGEVMRLESDLAGVERAIGRLVDAVEAGGDVPAVVKRLRQRQDERARLVDDLAQARADADAQPARIVSPEVNMAFCEELAGILAMGQPETVRDVLRLVLVEGHAWPDGRGELAWRSPWTGQVGRVEFVW